MKNLRIIALAISALFVAGLREQFATANVEGATGTHPGTLTKRADAATTSTHLLYKQGTDAFHVAVCGLNDYPVGTCADQPEAAEDIIGITPLGSIPGTRKMRCATALAANIDVFTAAAGLVAALPGSGGGTAYKVGRTVALAVLVGTNDYIVEVAPCMPLATTIPT
jgi:hypothetical protein